MEILYLWLIKTLIISCSNRVKTIVRLHQLDQLFEML